MTKSKQGLLVTCTVTVFANIVLHRKNAEHKMWLVIVEAACGPN